MARRKRKAITVKIHLPGKQFLAAAFSVVLSVFLVAVAVYGATTIDTSSVAVGTTTPGAAVAVKGAGLYEGFVSAGYFTSTSTSDSWLLGGLGLGTSTVSDTLNADGSLAVEGSAIFGGDITASTLKATSTTATSTISGFGLTVASSSFNVDGVTGRVSIGTTTFPDGDIANSGTVDPALTVSGVGSTNSATGTIFIANEAGAGGGQIILRSTDGEGCISITATRGGTAVGRTVGLTTKIVACPK